MMVKQIIEEIEKSGEFPTPAWFSKKFNIPEQEAKEILDYGVVSGVFYEVKENEYDVKQVCTTNSMDEFQGFLNRFFKDMQRRNAVKIFSLEIQTQKFEELQPFFYDKSGIWWLWNNEHFCWEITDDVDMLNMIKKITDKDVANSKLRTEIINALKQRGRLNIPEEIKLSWVQFKEKIIDIETGEEFDAKPSFFVANPILWKLGESEDTPIIDKLFVEWVGEEHKQELYEILAFCMVPYYFIHRIFWLIGSGSNGKSTYLKVLKKFVGQRNITSISLDALIIQRFAGAKLLKKLVCLMGETNFNTLQKTDFLKKLCGEDDIGGEIKNKNPFDFLNYAKLLIACNSMPMTADKTEGWYRRQKVIDFFNKFPEEKDVISGIPEKEFENLALKCLNIVKELWKKRIFTNDGDFEERRRRYEEKSNPIMLYIKNSFVKDVNSEVLFSEFYDGLKDFLIEGGFRELSPSIVSKQLKVEGLEVKTATIRKITAKWIIGIDKNNSNNRNNPNSHIDTIYNLSRKKGYLSNLGNFFDDSLNKNEEIEEDDE